MMDFKFSSIFCQQSKDIIIIGSHRLTPSIDRLHMSLRLNKREWPRSPFSCVTFGYRPFSGYRVGSEGTRWINTRNPIVTSFKMKDIKWTSNTSAAKWNWKRSWSIAVIWLGRWTGYCHCVWVSIRCFPWKMEAGTSSTRLSLVTRGLMSSRPP